MAPVVDELANLSDADVRAMATYLASRGDATVTPQVQQSLAANAEQKAETARLALQTPGARLFGGACAMCHEGASSMIFSRQPSLAVNSTVAAPVPDNLIRVILEGIDSDAARRNGAMPAFRENFDNRQIAELIRYVRARFAADRPAWNAVEDTVARIRKAPIHASIGH